MQTCWHNYTSLWWFMALIRVVLLQLLHIHLTCTWVVLHLSSLFGSSDLQTCVSLSHTCHINPLKNSQNTFTSPLATIPLSGSRRPDLGRWTARRMDVSGSDIDTLILLAAVCEDLWGCRVRPTLLNHTVCVWLNGSKRFQGPSPSKWISRICVCAVITDASS